MKTPDEFKKNLIACMDEAIEVAENGDAHDLLDFAHHAHARMSETLTYIQQLETKDALQSQRIADLADVLADARRERDAAVADLQSIKCCATCRRCKICKPYNPFTHYCEDGWQWRGVCSENTEVQDGNQADNP